MKTVISFSLGLLICLVVGFFFFRPVGTNFIRYLWWRSISADNISHGLVHSHDADIHYSAIGQGKPILLIHGGLANRLCWFSQLPWLVEAGYQAIVIDSRGHGGSGLGKSRLTYRLMATDGVNVMNHLNINQADILGWSDGANTALLMASLWPQRVGRIVAISGNFSPDGLTPQAQQQALTRSAGFNYWFYRLWSGAGEKFHELEGKLKQLWQHGPKLEPQDLQKIQSAVLIIQGEQDLVSPEHAGMMKALIPNSQLDIIPGGHATLITHAGQVNELIRHFLQTTVH
ncbi:MAG: alpha/beta hydrolase [Desulfuromonadales bacterium]|nr:alpha/beta hydrolase [Desulfuromonadales bacterium]MBN2792224.1 alpha/beta hydrolase [Desulfuromonadales bacterium]